MSRLASPPFALLPLHSSSLLKKVRLIDLGAATDLRVGINFNPAFGLLDPDYWCGLVNRKRRRGGAAACLCALFACLLLRLLFFLSLSHQPSRGVRDAPERARAAHPPARRPLLARHLAGARGWEPRSRPLLSLRRPFNPNFLSFPLHSPRRPPRTASTPSRPASSCCRWRCPG